MNWWRTSSDDRASGFIFDSGLWIQSLLFSGGLGLSIGSAREWLSVADAPWSSRRELGGGGRRTTNHSCDANATYLIDNSVRHCRLILFRSTASIPLGELLPFIIRRQSSRLRSLLLFARDRE